MNPNIRLSRFNGQNPLNRISAKTAQIDIKFKILLETLFAANFTTDRD